MAYPSNSDSAITRKSLATEWEREDAIIESANGSKRDAANRYRAQLTKAGWPKEDVKAELEAFRKAFARARQITKHGVDAVEEADARVEEILVEIRGSNAPRVTRVEIIEEFPADDVPAHDEDGVILEPDSNSPEIPDSSTEPASHVAAAVGSDPADEAEEATGQADSSAPLNPGGENANSVGNADASHSPDDAAVEKRPSREPHKLETAGSSPAPATISETPGAGAPAASVVRFSNKPLRPYCLRPQQCGGYGHQHCRGCETAPGFGQKLERPDAEKVA